jgi:hypothetical protein
MRVSQSSVYEDYSFVRCEAVSSDIKLPIFLWNLLVSIFRVDPEGGDSRLH